MLVEEYELLFDWLIISPKSFVKILKITIVVRAVVGACQVGVHIWRLLPIRQRRTCLTQSSSSSPSSWSSTSSSSHTCLHYHPHIIIITAVLWATARAHTPTLIYHFVSMDGQLSFNPFTNLFFRIWSLNFLRPIHIFWSPSLAIELYPPSPHAWPRLVTDCAIVSGHRQPCLIIQHTTRLHIRLLRTEQKYIITMCFAPHILHYIALQHQRPLLALH